MSKPSGRTKEVRDASISFSSANIKGAERMPFFRLRADAFPAWRGDRWRGAGVEISRAAARYLLAARKICGAEHGGRRGDRPDQSGGDRHRRALYHPLGHAHLQHCGEAGLSCGYAVADIRTDRRGRRCTGGALRVQPYAFLSCRCHGFALP